jgi:hypothetical protein
MTMRKHAELFATVGTWQDDHGKTHKRKVRCGVLMRDDSSGRMAVRIEALPVLPDWSGWLSVGVSRETERDDG